MAFNPSDKTTQLNNPTERANKINEPQFQNNSGYFPYDLTHAEYGTFLFGQITPTMTLDTVPGDRFVVHEDCKTICNQINGNFQSTINQYMDSIFVPMRSVFPVNYEKLIPNPTKGMDLPNSALPQVPFGTFIMDYLKSETILRRSLTTTDETNLKDIHQSIMDSSDIQTLIELIGTSDASHYLGYYLGRLTLLATVLSRGQLLDYLGVQYDLVRRNFTSNSEFQRLIDDYFAQLYAARSLYLVDEEDGLSLPYQRLNLSNDIIGTSPDGYIYVQNKSQWRGALSDIFEQGAIPMFKIYPDDFAEEDDFVKADDLMSSVRHLLSAIEEIFGDFEMTEYRDYIRDIDIESNPWKSGQYLNLGKVLAYQQTVAQYFTNNTVDNIFNSDLFMQLLRATMYPRTNDDITNEPVFDYNGVATEYDYISCGGFFRSLIYSATSGHLNRQFVWMTLMLLLRRSLRYGDYFATARPNLLAVGQLGIAVEGGEVSPIDITKNLLMQRYLNAVNYVGSGFLQYMASIHGVTPSDTGTFPRFISHRKVELQNQITNNTGENQGYQTTNIVGYTDNNAYDVFIDDFGYLFTVTTYDVLPVYNSGIDNSFHFSDRFDLFNPMLENIGDQSIRVSEMLGNPKLFDSTFGYTMRNAQYKYKLTKSHGAFVNSLPGYLMSYPVNNFSSEVGDSQDLHINPDFIRDKPMYVDRFVPSSTGNSPAEYYHFICSVVNEVKAARRIQATPPVLF